MRNLLLLLIMLQSVHVKSQAYLPINIDTSCFWVSEFDVNMGGESCHAEQIAIVEKDTSINGYQYWKIKSYTTDTFPSTLGCQIIFKYIKYSYIREDTSQHMIFSSYNSIDTLLIDFNKTAGDTMILLTSPNHVIVDSIAFNLINGISRRFQYGILGNSSYATIEGIGATHNFPIGLYNDVGHPCFKLKCYSKNGFTLYPDNPANFCLKKPPMPVGAKDIEIEMCKLSVIERTIVIENKSTDKGTIELFDISGKSIFHSNLRHGYTRFDFQDLNSGIYFVHIKNGIRRTIDKIILK